MSGPGPASQYRALFEHCAGRPGAVPYRRWGETAFKVRDRVFAFLNSPEEPSVTVKLAREDREWALERPQARRARYVGRFGWVTVNVSDPDGLRLALDLVDRSHRLVLARRSR
jgi:predicted DNA-binding protein (MmcQ/YjbR family)